MIKDATTTILPVSPLVELEDDEFSGFDPAELPVNIPAAVGNFHINLVANASVASAPASFMPAMQNAARIIEGLFSDNITLNISVGWGEIGGTPITRSHIALGGSSGHFYTYAQTVAALSNDRTTADDFAAVASLPASLNPNNNGSILIFSGEEKALGLKSATDGGIDGRIGFATDFGASYWLGGAIHEITHAMGRLGGSASYGILDLLRYSAPGQHIFAGGTPAYFSINNGSTRIANYSTVSDFGDFVTDELTPNDPLNAFISGNLITTIDAQIMDVIGYNRVLSQVGSVAIGDVVITEGNSGTSNAVFTITRTNGTAAFAINFATANGTATAGQDYASTSGTLNFAASVNSATVSVPVFGDTTLEPDETFVLNLSAITSGGTISRAQATGTIVNDDAGSSALSIADLSLFEGNAGTRAASFTVTRTGGAAALTVNYATANGTATAGSDYLATSGALTFAAGVNTQTISVTINGDTTFEPDETFLVNLSGITAGNTISRASATGTILNDDPGDDYRADSGTTGSVTVGGTATGNLEVAGDYDWFRVQLNAGQAYTIRIDGAAHGGGTLSDPLLVLYTAASVEVGSNDDGGGGLDPQLIYTPTTTGTYYIESSAFLDLYSGRYTVSVTTGVPRDDYAANAGTTGALSVRNPASGNLEAAGDHDWFGVQLQAGVEYTINLIGSPTGIGPLYDPYERLYSATGTLLAENDDGGGELASRIIYRPTTSGTYFVDAGGYDDESGGTYQFSMFSSSLSLQVRHRDFSADGSADLLWRGRGGEVAVWNVVGNGIQSKGTGIVADNPSNYWSIAGANDFNGDGRADILFRGQNGEVATWYMSGATQLNSEANFLATPGSYWTVAGTGDFGGDGIGDILWRGQRGEVAVWNMSEATVLAGSGVVASNPTNFWTIAGTGDFNGDGRSDVLFSGAGGAVAIWSMNGAQLIGGVSSFFAQLGAYWSVAGSGDFNGDGRSDILWRGQGGEAAIWNMTGNQSTSSVSNSVLGGSAKFLPNPGNFWSVQKIEDVSGDGRSDIIWRGADGSLYDWNIDDGVVTSATPIQNPGSYWVLS